ncbi:dehydrogenase [Rhizorhabdus dicambivorans]|uniref:SDR family NAD(P)-dependent oxidoreductase n=1 Tax=Rhizorhabdus dicambivorans TaxID=1850238 RepID=UPI000835C220|nr:SDR family oxidoreductase [Rhizorhabdus dicambivorans]ATE66408.1 dehydrogenase [Rhizorhabdus dicambivorans]
MSSSPRRRTALITGGSRGIGQAIATRLAIDHDLVIGYRTRSDTAEETAATCRSLGAQAMIHVCDITDPASLAQLADVAIDRFGRIDSLVTNAATGLHWPISVSGWQQVHDAVQVIAGSLAELVSRLAPHMEQGGRIVAISGLDSRLAVADHGLIGAGKAAIEAMIRNLAMELGPRGITANAVIPGATRTESLERALERKPGSEQPLIDCIPAGRLATPADVAHVVAFLCSAGAAYVNGTSILVDGGFSAGNFWTRHQRTSLEKGGWSARPLGQ